MVRQPKAKKAKAKMRKAGGSPVPTDEQPWPFVEVFWRDATSESSWKSHDDLPNTSAIVTRGWLVRSTKICITIAASLAAISDTKHSKDDNALDCGEIITIPRGCVVDINTLTIRRGTKRRTLQ